MRVLVFGQSGQVARELQRFEGVTALGRVEADLSDPAACAAIIAETQAEAVINAAAYTAVDKAEIDTKEAFRVNAEAPAAMAEAAARRGIPFLHISTDYVFDGTGETPWREEDPTGPMSTYGASKLQGEEGVRAANGTHVILRTSWVVSSHGHNFARTMLRLGAERAALSIVADQIGGPTPARAIAAALMEMARQLKDDPGKSGTYHFAGGPDTSWAGFAAEIFAQAALPCQVTEIPTSAYPTPATRPLNSRLECSKVNKIFNISRPDWRLGLAEILSELKAAP